MALGTACGLVAMIAVVGLLTLSGWFICATALAGMNLASAHAFNFFMPSIGVRLFAILRTLARYAERLFTHNATFKLLAGLRIWFYRGIEPLAPSRLMQYRSGDILNRIVADIDALDNLYLRVLSPTVVAALMVVGLFVLLWQFDRLIAAMSAAALSLAAFALPVLLARWGRATGRRLLQRQATLRVRIVEGLQGLPELIVFGVHQDYLARVAQDNRGLIQHQYRMSQIKGISVAMLTLLAGLATWLVLYCGVGLVNRDAMGGAHLGLVVLGVLATFEVVMPLPMAYQYLGHTRAAAKRLLDVVTAPPAVVFPASPLFTPKEMRLRFESVSFQYPGSQHRALKDVTLEIAQGEHWAIIGETGSGKTTLSNLLLRFWDPDQGSILLGGHDIRGLSQSALRETITVVSQTPHIFSATIRDNVAMGNPAATDNEIRAALRAAQLSDFVDHLPEGLDTWVGEAGRLLSGGQARRLAVARAMLRNSPIWILDEPTEGLDPATEASLMREVLRTAKGRTLLWITHRLIQVDRIDRVVVLDQGRLVRSGTYDTLT
jgi:ATP-binding cassette subfamily C protein CydC